MKRDRKPAFVEAYRKSGGIASVACDAVGISWTTFDRWRKEDAEFRAAVEDVDNIQVDFVESCLMSQIKEGNTQATIFYLKTKGRRRGWSERELPVPEASNALPSGDATKRMARVKNKRDYIVRLLKEQGKYTSELSVQVTITAQLLVRADMLAGEIFSDGHRAVSVEYSREGNARESINPKERLYLDTVQQAQRALRALGMNTDAKERKAEGEDSFAEFMRGFRE